MPSRNIQIVLIKILVLLVTYLKSISCPASEPQSYFLQNNLSKMVGDRSVTTLLRASDRLWIGTQNGLYFYDGSKLKIATSSDSNVGTYFSSHITALETSKQDRDIWISSLNQGIMRYIPRFNLFDQPIILDPSLLISALEIDVRGNIWVGTDGGVFVFSNKDYLDITPTEVEGLSKELGSISDISQDNSSRVWISAESGVLIHNPNTKETTLVCSGDPENCKSEGNRATALGRSSRSTMLIAYANGFFEEWNLEENKSRLDFRANLTDSIHTTKVLYHKDVLWIGTDIGLLRIDQNSDKESFFTIDNSKLSNNHITDILPTETGIWVATYKGLNLLTESSIANFNYKNSAVFDEVLSFTEGQDGQIFVGTYGGVYQFEEDTNKHQRVILEKIESTAANQKAMSLAADGHRLYVGTRGQGVKVINLKQRGYIHAQSILSKESITKLLLSATGKLWIATYSGKLYATSFDPEKSKLGNLELHRTTSDAPIITLTPINSGEILVGTEKHLYTLKEGGGELERLRIDFEELEFEPIILSVKVDNFGFTWIGTLSDGLFRKANGQRIAHRVKSSNLISGNRATYSIFEIQIDNLGNVWCSTSDGILKFDKEGEFIGRIGVRDGLQGLSFNFGASFIDSRGRLYFGGSNGYNRFDPHLLDFSMTQPKMNLTSLYINGIAPSHNYALRHINRIKLEHNDRSLRLEFNIDDKFSPLEAFYRFRLHPLQKSWISSDTVGIANYNNLAPGEYLFHAQGTDSAGNTNREGIQLQVIVHPPPWATWWAYTIYFLAAGLLAWLAWRWFYTYQLKERAMVYAREMNLEADHAIDELQEQIDVQDELISSVHQRSLATLGFLEDVSDLSDRASGDPHNKSHTRRSIQALICLENSLLYQQDRLYADLHRCTEDITSHLLTEHETDINSVSIINDVTPKPIDAKVGVLLATAIYELVENSLAHAFRDRPMGNFLKISLEAVDRPAASVVDYKLTVNDNGAGLPEEFTQVKGGGMAVLKLISEKLNGSVQHADNSGSEVSLQFSTAMLEN